MKDKYVEKSCEEIDAAVFSGDLLITDLQEFANYVMRWFREIQTTKAISK